MVFLAASLFLASLYFILQTYYLIHWHRINPIHIPADFKPGSSLSIVIVAHDEAAHIADTIKSILHQSYPRDLFELIIIDDRSVDKTLAIAQSFQSEQVRVFRLADFPSFIHPPAFKKSGIELGVHLSKFDYVVVTDADCIHDLEWLKTIACLRQRSDAVFMTGPLLIRDAKSTVEKLQQMECMGLLLATAAGIESGIHTIANGANMSFSKQAFNDVKGYEGNYHYASGDDVFLAEKMKKYSPDNIKFIKSSTSVVYTTAKHSWDALIKQRVRWAGKNKGLSEPAVGRIWLFIGAYHITMVFLLLAGLVNIFALIGFSILLLTKMLMDFISISSVSRFFQLKINVLDFLSAQVMYTYYIITLGYHMLVGTKGDWK